MTVILLSHRVADFDTWITAFNAHEPLRRAAGMDGERVFHTADDPNFVHITMDCSDLDKAMAFSQSDDLKKVMHEAGVLEEPKLTLLGIEHETAQNAVG